MSQNIESRTVHTIYIDLSDDVISKIEYGDDVYVVLQSRNSYTAPKRLSHGDIAGLAGIADPKPRKY